MYINLLSTHHNNIIQFILHDLLIPSLREARIIFYPVKKPLTLNLQYTDD